MKKIFIFILTGFLIAVLLVPLAEARKKSQKNQRSAASVPISGKVQKAELKIIEGEDFVGTGLFSDYGMWFQVPDSIEIVSSPVLYYSLSHSKVLSSASSLTIWLNGHPIDSLNLSRETVRKTTHRIEIPSYLIKQGFNSLEFRFFMVSNAENPYEDLFNPANWVVLDQSSRLEFDYRIKNMESLNLFPEPFVGMGRIHQFPLKVLLPENPSREELQSAAVLVQKFAAEEPFRYSKIEVLLGGPISKRALSNYNLLSLGTFTTNPLYGELLRKVPYETLEKVGEDKGIIAMMESPLGSGRSLCLISGPNPESLYKSAKILVYPDLVKNMKSSFEIVDTSEALPPQAPARDSNNISFKELGYYSVKLAGTFDSTASYSYDLPPHWEVKPGSRLVLDITYSPLLDPDNSVMTVVINGKPVKSFKFTGREERKQFVMTIPKEAFNESKLDVRVNVNLDVGKRDYINRYFDEAWIIINNSSHFHIPHKLTEDTGFKNFPAAFFGKSGLNPIKIIVPDDPSEDLVSAVLNTIYTISSLTPSNQYPSFDVLRVSEVTEETLQNYDLILFGSLDNNPFMRQINKDLPLPLDLETGKPIRTRMKILPQFLQDIAVLEIVPSIWSRDKFVLFMTGRSDDLIMQASENLIDRDVSSQWTGNIILLNEKDLWDSLAFGSGMTRTRGAKRTGPFLPIWIVVIVLICILTGGLIYWRHKHHSKNPFDRD